MQFFDNHVWFRHAGAWHRWSFEGREYLRKPLTDLSQRVVISKSAQSGISTIMRGQQWWLADQGYTSGMFFPTDRKMQTYVQVEINPALDQSDYLVSRIVRHDEERETQRRRGKRVDSLSALQLGEGMIVYCGMQSRLAVESYALDAYYLDEAALAMEIEDSRHDGETTTDEWLKDRVLNSPLAWDRRYSKPEIPGRNIDAEFTGGTQEHWAPLCSRCRSEVFLEPAWPQTILGVVSDAGGRKRFVAGEELDGGADFPDCDEWRLVCPRCRARIDPETYAWRAANPGAPFSSYRVSQIYSPLMSADRLAASYWSALRRGVGAIVRFYVSILGRARSGLRQPLVAEQYTYGERPLSLANPPQGCVAGLDVGDMCHLIIEAPRPTGHRDVVWIEEIPVARVKSVVPKRMKQFGAFLAIDFGPYRETMKELAAKLPRGRSVLCNTSLQRGVTHDWIQYEGHRLRVLNSSRQENLDRLCENTMSGKIVYPPRRLPQTQLLLKHHGQIIRDYDDDGQSYRYRRGTEMHLGSAQALAELAWSERRRLRIAAGQRTRRWTKKPRGA